MQAAAAESHPRSVAPAGSYVAITLRVPGAFGERYGAIGDAPTSLIAPCMHVLTPAPVTPHRYGAIGGVDAEGTATHAAPLVLCGVHTYEAHLSVRRRLGATDCD